MDGQYLVVHPTHPQARLVSRAADIARNGGVIVYPTDSTYAIGCRLGDKEAVDRIRAMRRLHRDHLLTLVCRDLSELAAYARVDNTSYRIVKHYLPGPFTFVLPATREVPRRLVHQRRKTLGLRVPNHAVAQALLASLGEPMLSTTLILPGDDIAVTNVAEQREALEHSVDAIVDGGIGGVERLPWWTSPLATCALCAKARGRCSQGGCAASSAPITDPTTVTEA